MHFLLVVAAATAFEAAWTPVQLENVALGSAPLRVAPLRALTIEDLRGATGFHRDAFPAVHPGRLAISPGLSGARGEGDDVIALADHDPWRGVSAPPLELAYQTSVREGHVIYEGTWWLNYEQAIYNWRILTKQCIEEGKLLFAHPLARGCSV
jgi:hypothetical protein